MASESAHGRLTSSVGAGWGESGSFFSSVVSGALLGYVVDRWLDTSPWFLAIGVGLGAFSGFRALYRMSAAVTMPARTLIPGFGIEEFDAD